MFNREYTKPTSASVYMHVLYVYTVYSCLLIGWCWVWLPWRDDVTPAVAMATSCRTRWWRKKRGGWVIYGLTIFSFAVGRVFFFIEEMINDVRNARIAEMGKQIKAHDNMLCYIFLLYAWRVLYIFALFKYK